MFILFQIIKDIFNGIHFKKENEKNEKIIQRIVEIIFRGKSNEQLTLKKIEKTSLNSYRIAHYFI